MPLDAVEEVAAAEALGDEVVLVLPLDRLDQLDHAQVVQLRQDAHLRHHLALRLLQVSAQLRVCQVHHLHRHRLAAALLRTPPHLREAASPQHLRHSVLCRERGDSHRLRHLEPTAASTGARGRRRRRFRRRRRGRLARRLINQLHVIVRKQPRLAIDLPAVPALVLLVLIEDRDDVSPLERELVGRTRLVVEERLRLLTLSQRHDARWCPNSRSAVPSLSPR